PALAEGELRVAQLRPLEHSQLALFRVPLAVAQFKGTTGEPWLQHPLLHFPAAEVEDAGALQAGADFEVESHRGRRYRFHLARAGMIPRRCHPRHQTRSSSTTTASCSTPSRSGPGPSRIFLSVGAPSSPRRTSWSWSAPRPRSPA